MADINLELARKCLNIAKKTFKTFTGMELEMAKEIIQLEDQLSALEGTAEQSTKKQPDKQPVQPKDTSKEIWETPQSEVDRGKIPLNTNFDNQKAVPPPQKPKEEVKPF